MNNEKKYHSNVLMVVGVIFILLAGAVCVSKAWNYLPLVVKQGCLFVVAMAGLGSSYALTRKDRLHKTDSALFYIGNGFLGYFLLSVMGSVFGEDWFGFWKKSCIVTLVILILVGMKLAVKKSVVEYVAGVLLLNWLVCSGYYAMKVDRSVYAFLYVLVGLLVCGISYLMRASFRESRTAGKVIRKMLLVQESIVCWQLMISVLLVSGNASIGEKLCLGIALFGGFAMAAYLFMQREKEALQSVQYWIIMMLILLLVCYNHYLESDLIATIGSSVTLVALMIWAEWQKQKTITRTAGVALAVLLVYATREIWLSIAWWIYMMVAGILMVGIAIWREKSAETKEEEMEE